MKIRFATQNDKNQVLNLIAELKNTAFLLRDEPLISSKNLPQELFEHLLQRDDVKIFIAEENGTIIGVATLYIIPILRRTKPRGELEELIVTQSMRGKGVGKKLFQAVLEYCKKHNIYALQLSSYKEMFNAHGFYEKMGGIINEKRFRFDIK